VQRSNGASSAVLIGSSAKVRGFRGFGLMLQCSSLRILFEAVIAD
jgi:hypothetical protein